MEGPQLYHPPPFRSPDNNGICSANPVPLHSPGVWDADAAKNFLGYPLPLLLVQLVIIFVFTQSIHVLLKRLKLPRTISALLAGFVLGPTVMGNIVPSFGNTLFPISSDIHLNALSKIGYIYYMFLAGVKMDPGMVRTCGRKPWTIGVVSALFPVIVAISSAGFLGDLVGMYKLPGIRFLAGTLSLTPFPVVAHLLHDLKIMNTEIGHLALACSLIRELTRFGFFSFNTFMRLKMESTETAIQAFTIFILAVIGMKFISKPVFAWIIRQTPEGKSVKRVHISLIVATAFASAFVAENIGIPYHYGPFLLGLCVPDGPPLGSTMEEKLDTVVSGLLAPLLVTYCGLRSNLFEVNDVQYQMVLWGVCFGSGVVRFIASLIPALFCKIPFKDALALTLILCPQGIVELAHFLYALESETINDQSFATATEAVFITSIAVPLLVTLVYDFSRKYTGYQKRSIAHSETESELRIFACVHRPDDAMAAIKLIETANPTKEKPICVFALHLVDLVGRAAPLIINHQLGQKGAASGIGSRSLQIIELFDHFEQQSLESAVTTQKFTAVSLPKFMHDDICLMAFDKFASLIVLPFHKKWNPQGKVIQDNKVWRTINRNVLEMAPCSVGILIDRRKVNRPSPASPTSNSSSNYRVSVIFVGGDDDREALAFAKRVVNAPGIQLTVVRLYGDYDDECREWETMLDDELFRELRISSGAAGDVSNVKFREELVNNGAELAQKIHTVEEFSDLILVGRRHNENLPMLSGLTEWMEVPELGAIGDILAAGDTSNPVSVLVVQQQMHLKVK